MYGFYLIFFLTTALFEKVICELSISFCTPTTTDVFPFPGDCTRYISCHQGQTTIFICPHDSTFNSELNQCDYEQKIDNCQNSIGNLKDLPISCSKGSRNSFPHPFDCKKYIVCNHGLTYTLNCSSETVYNYFKSICDWRYKVLGCFGNLGNGFTLRGDVIVSSINLKIGSMNFKTKEYTGNEHQINQLIENENKLSNNQNYQLHQTNKPPSENNPHYLQPGHNNHFTNKPTSDELEKHSNYLTQNEYINGNQQYNRQTNFGTYRPISSSIEKFKNDNDQDLNTDIRVKDDELDDRSISKIKKNGITDTTLSFDQVLAINNLMESENMPTNTGNKIENVQKQNTPELHELYNSFSSANIVEPVNNYIDEVHVTERINSEIHITETPTKTIVESFPSINLLNYNYIEDYDHGNVQIDQDYSNIRNHTASFTVNNNNNNNNNEKEGRMIQKLNHKSTELKKLFNDNSTDDIFFSTIFITPFKSEGDNQHTEVINQFSGQVLRLKGGSSAQNGYVEIRGIGFIGQCDNSWNLNKAHKICKKLGYKRGAKITWKGLINDTESPLLSLESDIFCQNNRSEFQVCTFKNTSKCSIERDIIGLECFLDSPVYCNENEVPFHNNCYHLVNSSLELDHENAIQYCSSRNSSLLYITAQNENDFISEWLTQKYPQVESIMTAGIGFTIMGQTIWVWQDSEKSSLNFMKWWPGWRNEKMLPPSVNSSTSCIVMKNKFPCDDQPNLNCKTDGYFFWDIEDCTSPIKGSHYICKRPYNKVILIKKISSF